MIRILLAPTAFKGSFTPAFAAAVMKRGVERFAKNKQSNLYIDTLPIADGGDGTIEALHSATGGILRQCTAQDALGKPKIASWLQLESRAIAELASCCGIGSLERIDAMNCHTAGLGEVLGDILKNREISEIITAVGGSASTDGGSGALAAMGGRFFDRSGAQLTLSGGRSLHLIKTCDLSDVRSSLTGRVLRVITDVTNPLLGASGAAHVYGPQKGADEAQVELLDEGMRNFAAVMERECGKHLRDVPGAGAAGGTAFGLACVGAEISEGFAFVSEATNLIERIKLSDLVISGEGRTDATSLQGKVVGQLWELCKAHRKRFIVVSGGLGSDLPEDLAAFASTTYGGTANEDEIAATVERAIISVSGSTTNAKE